MSIITHSQKRCSLIVSALRSHDAKHSSQVEFKVWHRSQSKKKKRKILVASACHSLGELVKKQGLESRTSEMPIAAHSVH